MKLPPAGRFARASLGLVTLGYGLHLLDESRFGLPYEWRYLTPTLLLLAVGGVGFLVRRPRLALPATGAGGFLVAYFGGFGHFLPFGSLYPMALAEGPGGFLLGINTLLGFSLTVAAFAATATLMRERRIDTPNPDKEDHVPAAGRR